MKQDARPTNVGLGDLAGFRWPVTALTSITHRIAGAVLFVGIGFMLYGLDASLSGAAAFESLKSLLVSPFGRVVVWVLLSALAWHFVAGVKHLLMDMGLGETLAGGTLAARLTLLIAVILIALAGLWVLP